MNQNSSIILAGVLSAALLAAGCSDGDDKSTSPTESQQAVWGTLQFYESYQYGGETLDSVCWLYGNVSSDRIPEFHCYDAVFPEDSIRCSDDRYYSYGPGYIQFESVDLLYSLQVTTWFRLHVLTSIGKVTGQIDRPPAVKNIEFSVPGSIDLGESFYVTWDNVGADYYYLHGNYQWWDAEDQYHSVYLDTFVTDSRVDFDGSRFMHDGQIFISAIGSASGSFPAPGASGNMSGQGTGYLNYLYPAIIQEQIVVGTGIAVIAEDPKISPGEQMRRFLRLFESQK